MLRRTLLVFFKKVQHKRYSNGCVRFFVLLRVVAACAVLPVCERFFAGVLPSCMVSHTSHVQYWERRAHCSRTLSDFPCRRSLLKCTSHLVLIDLCTPSRVVDGALDNGVDCHRRRLDWAWQGRSTAVGGDDDNMHMLHGMYNMGVSRKGDDGRM